MHLTANLAGLVTFSQLVTAAPAPNVPPGLEMRLIKTAEDDPGRWVTEQEKFDDYTARNIGFFDITDVTDGDVLRALSTSPDDLPVKRQSEYPGTLSHVEEATALISQSSTDGPKDWLKTFSSYFNRHYQAATGRESADWLFEKVKLVASVYSKITVEQFSHSFDQPSIIVRIPGEKDDLVILGAHLDSTSGNATSASPGADDDGSGTVVVLESLRVLAEAGFTPSNTIEFHFYAGEEGGLLGSQDIFSNYRRQGKNVLAFVNEDMAGYSGSGMFAVFTDYVDDALSQYVRLIAEGYVGKTPGSGSCGYGCSDHASGTANGFPSAFVHEDVSGSTSPYIHTVNDSYDTIMWDAIDRHVVFSIGFLVEASYL